MKDVVKTMVKKCLEPLIYFECRVTEWLVGKSYKRLKWIQWRVPPQPEFFDHRIDLYYQWLYSRNPLWLERGIFGHLAIKENGRVLELSCGDGFNTRNFYSSKAYSITACDFDPKAINIASKKNSAPNITYVLADIRTNMPEGQFDNVVWDAAIEHFTPEEIEKIMKEIKKRLTTEGLFCGYTIVQRKDSKKSLSHHKYEFKDKRDLMRFISPYFKNVKVFETIYPERHNLYFWASDTAILPFNKNWPSAVDFDSKQ